MRNIFRIEKSVMITSVFGFTAEKHGKRKMNSKDEREEEKKIRKRTGQQRDEYHRIGVDRHKEKKFDSARLNNTNVVYKERQNEEKSS